MRTRIIVLLCFISSLCYAKEPASVEAVDRAMQNVMARECISLNGNWDILPDPSSLGPSRHWEHLKTPKNENQLVELRYDGWYKLYVPGDWNHQRVEFSYYQGDMWYKREFTYAPKDNSRVFLHFGAVSQNCSVFLNGERLGNHKGGFTPFQYEITDKLLKDRNVLIVRVDNKLSENGIPARYFDWWNYGGITRDVNLIYVPKTFIEDYTIQLTKGSLKEISIKVKLNGEEKAGKKVTVNIPEIEIQKELTTDNNGEAALQFKAKLDLWCPENPKLYDVTIESGKEKVADRIGFRSIEVKGEDILLNGKKVFMYGINFHEEIACQTRRATDGKDARYLLEHAKEVGANFIRLAHYPQNEYTVRMAEEMGFMIWEEIPLWQGIRFGEESVQQLANQLLEEMISRDKNRCGIIIWSISNETGPRSDDRNAFLPKLASHARQLDPTRLISSALDAVFARRVDDKMVMGTSDPLTESLDVVGVNKYMGWYNRFPCEPKELDWYVTPGKPTIITEFGAEASYGNHSDTNNINSWSEEFMARVYRNNINSFLNSKNIRGIAPWILFDFRSPGRSNALHQQGWNMKGILSTNGDKKQAWYIINEAYKNRIFDSKIK